MESCSAEMKQQRDMLMLKPPGSRRLTDVTKSGLHSPWQNVWTLVQVVMEESKTPKWAAPAANHVQQPWNVYSQAYMKAARNSIVTQIGAGKAFWAFASLMRWENDTGETNPHHSAEYYVLKVVTTSGLLQNDETNNWQTMINFKSVAKISQNVSKTDDSIIIAGY